MDEYYNIIVMWT